MKVRLTFTLPLFHSLVTCLLGLKLGAFNVRTFGQSKASDGEVMEVLARIAVRYDILLIQEIKDSNEMAIIKLQDKIRSDHNVKMELIISDRLGRTRYKEQYAFLYRKDRGISVLDSLHFDDGDEASGDDLFEREPFVVRFQALNCEVKDFTLVAIHATTSETVAELSNLTLVVQDIKKAWRTSNILILGDLNADCAYVPQKAWKDIALRQNSDFWWPIGNDVDTTVRESTDCAYDRFIITGGRLRSAVVPGSARPFNFQVKYRMSETEALKVSDHYPIELELRQEDTSRTNTARRSVSTGIVETLQHILQGILKTFSRQKVSSEL